MKTACASHVPARHLAALPAWRLRAARATNRDLLLSLTLQTTTLAHIRVESWWDEMCVLKASRRAPSPSPLHPITSADIERVQRLATAHDAHHTQPRRAWLAAWTRHFAHLFAHDMRYRMLWQGSWALAPTPDYALNLKHGRAEDLAQYMQDLEAPCYVAFHRDLSFPWPLRFASDPESARVTWWRKLARRDALPPVLCMHLTPLIADVILDGHDRILAALLEDKTPEFIRLEYVSARALTCEQIDEDQARVEQDYGYMRGHALSHTTVDRLNHRARSAYSSSHEEIATRAWPIRGGITAWMQEVEARTLELPEAYREERAFLLQQDIVEESVYQREP